MGVEVSGEVDSSVSAPIITSAALDALFGSAPGSLIYRGSASWTTLSPGANGQLMQSGGINAAPSWASASAAIRADAAQSLTATQQDQAQQNLGLPAAVREYLKGLTLSTAGSSATFSIASGVAADSTDADLMALTSALSKTTAAWAAGNNAGALDTGAIAANTWYEVHQIKNPNTQAVDILISLSPTAPTLPTGFTLFRRIGSMRTDASSHWILFKQYGRSFYWGVAVTDANGVTVTSGADVTLTITVPNRVRVMPYLRVGVACNSNNGAAIAVRSPDLMASETAPSANSGNADAGVVAGGLTIVRVGASTLPVWTNTNGQIIYNAQFDSGGTGNASVRTYGWFDDCMRGN